MLDNHSFGLIKFKIGKSLWSKSRADLQFAGWRELVNIVVAAAARLASALRRPAGIDTRQIDCRMKLFDCSNDETVELCANTRQPNYCPTCVVHTYCGLCVIDIHQYRQSSRNCSLIAILAPSPLSSCYSTVYTVGLVYNSRRGEGVTNVMVAPPVNITVTAPPPAKVCTE